MPESLKICIQIDNIQFDPEEPLTAKFRPESTIYQVYFDTVHQVTLGPKMAAYLTLPGDFVAANGFVRLIAKDKTMCKGRPGTGIDSDIEARVGTIAIKAEDFEMHRQRSEKTFSEWITLFDDVDDDEFDGDFGVDDEELPMIYCNITINAVEKKPEVKSPVKPKIEIQASESPEPLAVVEAPPKAMK